MLDPILHSLFYEIAALLVLAAAIGFIGMLLRQPLIVSFIAVGIIAGPSVLGIVRSSQPIDLLSELGIALLLFLVGIKLDVKLIQSLGVVSLTTGLGQIIFTAVFGYFIGLALGLDAVTSLYVAVALTFSSTIIIVKLLSDKGEIESLHGRIALGFLIVQDIFVVFAMIVLSAVGIGTREEGSISDVLGVFAAGGIMLALVILFIRYFADWLVQRLARSPELLICFAIAQATLFAALGDYLGFGKELGGLLAGVSLASTPYRETIAARLAPLRDFLLLFFFVALGTKLDLADMERGGGVAAIVFSLFVLIGNPIIVLAIMGVMGYRKRTGFLAGLTVAQISEFSLIFMAMGVTLGHVNTDALGLVTFVGLITIAASTYMITYSHQLFAFCEPLLGIFERKGAPRESSGAGLEPTGYDVLLFGLGRYGGAIASRLRRKGYSILGIDFNPDVVRMWQAQGLDCVYGDATDPEFVAQLPLWAAHCSISTVPYHDAGLTHADPRLAVIQILRGAGFTGTIAVSSHRGGDAEELRHAGADLVLEPFQDAADQAVDLVISKRRPERIEIGETTEQREPVS